MNILKPYTDQEACNDLADCSICPRLCSADRINGPLGYCNNDSGFNISTICIHKGEEPVISGKNGICNVFFSHCNLQCIFCQNFQISQNRTNASQNRTLEAITDEIIEYLDQGCKSLGFVSASHMVPQMVMIINSVHRRGRTPYIVYNSNGYDKTETLRRLEGLIDVYLPDFKYGDNELGKPFSDVNNYFTVALKALKEMYRQMGPNVITDDSGVAMRGMIVRHLVLPLQVDNSIKALRTLADQLSPKIYLSLMAQYHPIANVMDHPALSRSITKDEYELVCNELDSLGFVNGWVQELESNTEYLPDFNFNNPFEKTE